MLLLQVCVILKQAVWIDYQVEQNNHGTNVVQQVPYL